MDGELEHNGKSMRAIRASVVPCPAGMTASMSIVGEVNLMASTGTQTLFVNFH